MIFSHKTIKGLTLGLLLAAGLIASVPAMANVPDFTFTLSNPNIIAPAGTTAIWNGTVTFTSTPSSLSFFLPSVFGPEQAGFGEDSALDDFLSNAPTAGSTYTGAIFHLTLKSSDTNGEQPLLSSFGIGDPSGAIFPSASVTVGTPVVATPEPSSLAVFGLGGIVLLGFGIGARKMNTAKS